MKVYLAGPMTGLTMEEAAAWRERVAEDLNAAGIQAVSPLRGKYFLERSAVIADAYRETILGNDKAIVNRDRWDVRRVDVVLLNLLNGAETVSIGSMVELGWADACRWDGKGKIIVVVMDQRPGVFRNIHDHAFVREMASYIVPSLEDAVDLIIVLDKIGGGA